MTIGQRLTGDLLGEAGREPVVMIEAGVIVPHRRKINQAIERAGNVR